MQGCDKIFSSSVLDDMSASAKSAFRLRKNLNIHSHFDEPCQRLFNAIEPGSYIQPHRHFNYPRPELLVAIRGLFAYLVFDNEGTVLSLTKFGTELYTSADAIGVEISPNTWHTVVALMPGSILLEVKQGPFNPDMRKDLASWAPDESDTYLGSQLLRLWSDLAQSL
jgi:cupin fold WbuC family metalloprotein